MAPPEKTSPFRLMVEGKDDKFSIIELLRRHGYRWDDDSLIRPYVVDVGGIDAVLDGLSAALKTYLRIGVVVDADLEPANRWSQLHHRLNEAGVTVPSALNGSGLIVDSRGVRGKTGRFGVWVMPDNRSMGALEDFLAALVPSGDPCWTHAETATTRARQLGAPLSLGNQSKGVIHTWLAWQEHPGLPFGTALSARVLSHDSSKGHEFVQWFRELFDEAEKRRP
jgi:hypothetical protein